MIAVAVGNGETVATIVTAATRAPIAGWTVASRVGVRRYGGRFDGC